MPTPGLIIHPQKALSSMQWYNGLVVMVKHRTYRTVDLATNPPFHAFVVTAVCKDDNIPALFENDACVGCFTSGQRLTMIRDGKCNGQIFLVGHFKYNFSNEVHIIHVRKKFVRQMVPMCCSSPVAFLSKSCRGDFGFIEHVKHRNKPFAVDNWRQPEVFSALCAMLLISSAKKVAFCITTA